MKDFEDCRSKRVTLSGRCGLTLGLALGALLASCATMLPSSVPPEVEGEGDACFDVDATARASDVAPPGAGTTEDQPQEPPSADGVAADSVAVAVAELDSVPDAPPTIDCEELLLDDLEDGDNQILIAGGRSGYWYSYADESSALSMAPRAGALGGVFAPALGGYGGSRYASRLRGTLSDEDICFAGMGFNFVDPRSGYDISDYDSLVFWARASAGAGAKVRVQLPDSNTDPDGGRCASCFNAFGASVTLTDSWTRYVLPFEAMEQEGEWGDPRPPRLDTSVVYSVQFQWVAAAGDEFDFWIDDISLGKGCAQAGSR